MKIVRSAEQVVKTFFVTTATFAGLVVGVNIGCDIYDAAVKPTVRKTIKRVQEK